MKGFTEKERIKFFQIRLLQWYTRHGRLLPWRNTRDPYHILVSEIMLHQTQVNRVLPKYLKWLRVYPTFESLAETPLNKVKDLWFPLGYNIRPERLQNIAKLVVNKFNGSLPQSLDELMAFNGIGRYTAGAILSFAFHKDAPIVDTNVRRLTQRVFGIQGNYSRIKTRKRIWQLARTMIPAGKAYIFNQAILDFGALVCMARNPVCFTCFIKDYC